VRTHYPLTRELGIQITDANAWSEREDGPNVVVPHFLKEIVEETSRLARKSPHVNQASGVSVRMSIANCENLVSNAERRALALGESEAVARVSDLEGLVGSSRGKIELQMTEETGEEDKLLGRIIEEAVKTVFDQHFDPKQFRNIVEYFESGNTIEVGDKVPAAQILKRIEGVREFRKQVDRAAGELDGKLATGPLRAQLEASIAEFILDGLYTHNRLNKKQKSGGATYGQ
jgi:magnesium chelatase subunit I